jgi:hypothetical protein
VIEIEIPIKEQFRKLPVVIDPLGKTFGKPRGEAAKRKLGFTLRDQSCDGAGGLISGDAAFRFSRWIAS